MNAELTPVEPRAAEPSHGDALISAVATLLAAQGIAVTAAEAKGAARVWQRLAPAVSTEQA